MPSSLMEVSGIAFNHGLPDAIYAIQDEEGKFFKMKLGVKKQSHSKFAKSGDYEDVAILHDRAVVLKSNGNFFSFNLSDANDDDDIKNVAEWKDLLPDGEYEGLFADEASDQLYVICKNCAQDEGTKVISGYTLKFDDSIYKTGEFSINLAGISALEGKVKKGLRPSALAKNPITREWYVLSSVNKCLVILDEQWKVKQVVTLSSNMFIQPEGIAFDNAGNLYISNEGDDTAEGNILKFSRH